MWEAIDVSELFRICGKLLMMQLATVFPTVISMGTLLKRKRSSWIVIGYVLAKFFVDSVLLDQILAGTYRQEIWWQITHFTFLVAMAFCTFFIFLYVYEGLFVKVAVAGMITEAIDMGCVMLALLIVNGLAGKAGDAEVIGAWSNWNLLMPVISYLIYALFYALFHSVMRRYRESELKHTTFWWCVFSLYMVYGIWSNIPDPDTNGHVIFLVFFYSGILTFLTVILFCVFLILIGKHEAEMEYQYLKQTKRITEAQYQLLKKQIDRMEESRRQVERNMQQLLGLKEQGTHNSSIRNYIDALQTEYASIDTGIYSNDWTLDALFCHEAAICKQYGIRIDFLAQEFQSNRVQAAAVFPAVLKILDYGIHQNASIEDLHRELKMHLATVRNCIVIEVDSGCPRTRSVEEHRLLRELRKRGYQITVERKEQKLHMVLLCRMETCRDHT